MSTGSTKSTNATTRFARWTAGAIISGLGLPAVAAAQQSLEPEHVTVETTARADRLDTDAVTLQGSTDRFGAAARMHERSAELRSAEDPRAATSLRTAAELRYYSGDSRAAANLMERAALQAAARGDVVTAANAYVDAGIIARELKQPERAADFGRRAEILMTSPLLSGAQRAALQGRIVREPAVGVVRQQP
jgi:hypothetical protein